MISRSEGADLLESTLQGPVADQLRFRGCKSSALFHELKIVFAAVALGDRPARAITQQLFLILLGKFGDGAFGSDAGWNKREKIFDYPGQLIFDLLEDQTGLHQPNSSIDVVADTSGRNDAVMDIYGGHAADRKPITPMNI